MKPAASNQRGLAAIAIVLGVLALLTPLQSGEDPGPDVGVLLVLTACLELFHGFRRSNRAAQRSAWTGGAITVGLGLFLINARTVPTAGCADLDTSPGLRPAGATPDSLLEWIFPISTPPR